ncbi:nuclear condensing complex subunit [Crepidotus variabilis]|uniref:Nuclear condensing complex subunit n=1 Tax=Crepidotus variabilis TaxID=179855 RepID=A0A9P6JTH2_9AGAR|nr:nuclear condensing complex subunit [Crepidotus variabilis]
MPARVRQPSKEEKIAQLTPKIGQILNEASTSATTHAKNNVNLWKLQQELSKIYEPYKGGKKITGEKAFQNEMKIQMSRVIPLKKATPVADRTIKFMAGYVKYINEKALDPKADNEDVDELDDDDDNPSSRFTESLLKWLLEGFEAKNKDIRYRVLQTVAAMISHLGAIDEVQYNLLRTSLIGRLSDKENSVRLQAAVALSKLCGADDADSEDADPIERLLHCMAYDTSADVRKAVLVNILVTPQTLDDILARTRDTDTGVRKMVYDSVLRLNLVQGDEKVIGPSHPLALTIEQRELIARNGLGDRDPTVRKVAASLLANWVDYAHLTGTENDADITNEPSHRIESNILCFLKLFDLTFKEGEVAANGLKSLFHTRTEIFDILEFNAPQYWTDMTPEKAFLARVFVDHCIEENEIAKLETALPVVTQMAFILQDSYNALQELDPPETHTHLSDDEQIQKEEEYTAKELILAEILRLAANLDYSDEIGRRKMDMLTCDMVRKDTLSTKLMGPCLAVIRVMALSERDLIRLIVEIISDIRDAAYGENDEPADQEPGDQSFDAHQPPQAGRKSLDDMTPEKRADVERTDLRCLSLSISMLEQVNDTIDNNMVLGGLLTDLIIPSVHSSNDSQKELGLKCLGLCSLIAKPLAANTVPLLIGSIPSVSQTIKMIMIQTLFDIFMVHGGQVFKDPAEQIAKLTNFLLENIEKEQDPTAKALFCKGTSKLVLSGMIKDVTVVKNLIKAYVSPATADNQDLRQCLAYFLPVYSQSSSSNQGCMREMFIHIFLDICQDRREAEEEDEEDEIVSSSQIADMFILWTDPTSLNAAMLAQGGNSLGDRELGVHLDLAEDVLKTLFEKDLKEDKRVLCQLLNKLQIPSTVDDRKIQSIKLLVDHLRHRRPLKDSVCNTALGKFEAAIIKKFEKQLENLDEEEFRKLEELNELFEFLDSIIPLDEDELIDLEPLRKGKKR